MFVFKLINYSMIRNTKHETRNTKLLFKFLIALTLLFNTSCDKDKDDDSIDTAQLKYEASSISSAQDFFNQNAGSTTTSRTFGLNGNADWEKSKSINYKKTPALEVDILYTPVYINTQHNVKAFIATTENQGVREAKKVYVIYKTNDISNGLNAYILIYNLEGNLEYEYNYVNGTSVPFPTTNGSQFSRTGCQEDIGTLTEDELVEYFENCASFDTITITATLDADDSDGGGFGTQPLDTNPWIVVEGLGYNGPTGTSNNGSNPTVFAPNTVTASAASISIALNIPFGSIEFNWLLELESTNPELLQEIANYLNANKEPLPPNEFENAGGSQFPVVNEEVVNSVLEIINISIANPNISFELDNDINPDDVPQELHFETEEELLSFLESFNSTNIISETTVDPNNPSRVIERCTFPDLSFDFNIYVKQTLGDNYSVDEVTSDITGITVFVAYEQLNWVTTTINPLANLSNVDVNSHAEVTLVVQGVGTIMTFAINFNIWLNMNNGSQNTGTMTMD